MAGPRDGAHSRKPRSPRELAGLSLGALGVVYGDIGTSPLYAFRECVSGPHGVAATESHVLGVLSLIFWALVLSVSLKYLVFILRADNQGEGGILALFALVERGMGRSRKEVRRAAPARPVRRWAPLRRRDHHARRLGASAPSRACR